VDESVRAFLCRFNSGKRLHRVETIEFVPASNPQKSIAVNAFPLFSPKHTSSVFGAVVLFRDISAEVMARGARDEFVAHVAHEIKSPLNVINMQADALAEFGAEDAEIRVNSVNVIQDEVDRLSRMIGDLLNITQIEAGSVSIDRKPVKLRELLEDAFTATMRRSDARGIVPQLDLPRTLPTIQADKDLLRLALNNLLTNAIKYNRAGGAVTLAAVEHDDRIEISVSDEGVGIAADEQQRIFEKFYRSQDAGARAREGHGLGLALAKHVLDLHHGTVQVDSQLGEGTTFTISLKKEMVLLKEAV
jgi:signal transduction histidine kinase